MNQTNRLACLLMGLMMLVALPALGQDGETAFDGAGEFGSGAGEETQLEPGGTQPAPPSQGGGQGGVSDVQVERFDDWGVRCGQANDGSGERCEMFQQVTRDDSDETVLRVVIGFPPNQDRPAAIFQLPLGVVLPPGVAFRVDEGEPVRFPVQICVPQGCRADVPLSQEMIGAMRAGSRGYLRVQTPRGGTVDLPISLMGFTAALDRISG